MLIQFFVSVEIKEPAFSKYLPNIDNLEYNFWIILVTVIATIFIFTLLYYLIYKYYLQRKSNSVAKEITNITKNHSTETTVFILYAKDDATFMNTVDALKNFLNDQNIKVSTITPPEYDKFCPHGRNMGMQGDIGMNKNLIKVQNKRFIVKCG